MNYELEKHLWTNADFDRMGWHDSMIYKMQLETDLALDIDYILKWNKPDLEGLPFTFWVAPATLVFESVTDLRFDIEMGFDKTLEIDDIERESTDKGIKWTIVTQQGYLEFFSPGYKQFIRQQPFFKFGQCIYYIERYGFSIEQTTNQGNPNRYRDDVVEQREKELEEYEIVKQRHLKRNEQKELELKKENGEVDLKNYLINKRRIKEELERFDELLKDGNWR